MKLKTLAILLSLYLEFLLVIQAWKKTNQPVVNKNAKKFLSGCSFYCFFIPNKDATELDLSFRQNISCSHMVYGWATLSDDEILFPSKNDVVPHKYFGNFKVITSLRDAPFLMKVLLGIRQSSSTTFLEDEESSRRAVKRMVRSTRRHGFNGMFLKFDRNKLMSPGFERFVKLLNEELDQDIVTYKGLERLSVVLSFGSESTSYIHRKLLAFDRYFTAFYVWSDETLEAREHGQDHLVQIDALFPSISQNISRSQTISDSAERLAASGISRHKIIIGLNAWVRIYKPSSNISKSDEDKSNGKITYQDFCRLRRGMQLMHDNTSQTTWLSNENGSFSLNEPDTLPLIQKLSWIGLNGFGGIGVYSIQDDDPQGYCKKGILPVHRSMAEQFGCSSGRNARDIRNQKCYRLCQLNLDYSPLSNFTFKQMDPEWCSHIVLSSVEIVFVNLEYVRSSTGLDRALQLYKEWPIDEDKKPLLILSIGASHQLTEVWRLVLVYNTNIRQQFVNGIRQLVLETGADGIEINWTKGRMGFIDRYGLTGFIGELRGPQGLPKNSQIFLSMAPGNIATHSVDNAYDFKTLNSLVNYFILQGYGFHKAESMNTGHHSPLFSNSDMLTDPRMTIEGITEDLQTQGIPAEKIIVGLSAVPIKMKFHENVPANERNIGDQAKIMFVDAAIASAGIGTFRSTGSKTIDSQTTVCEIMKKANVSVRFIEKLGVPYLVDGQDFLAYDDIKSITIKTVWISIKNFGGIAFHGLERDNIDGQCPRGRPFYLLRAIADAQVCDMCQVEKLQKNANVTITNNPGDQIMANYTKTKENSTLPCKRSPPRFHISCCYRIPRHDADDPLDPENILYKQCSELVLEETLIDSTGKLSFGNGGTFADHQIKAIKRLAKDAGGVPIVAAIRSYMNKKQLFDLLENEEKRSKLVMDIEQHVSEHEFAGIELAGFDHFVNHKLKVPFSDFLSELQQSLSDDNNESCLNVKSISLRIPVWKTNLSEAYDIKRLNSLNGHIIMEALHQMHVTEEIQTKLINPFFAPGLNKSYKAYVQSTTLESWLRDLRPEKIMLQLPMYGMMQTLNIVKNYKADGVAPRLGDPTTHNPTRKITQQKICKFKRELGSRSQTMYERVSEYATTRHKWVSFEGKSSVAFKVKYAMRKNLGGVSLEAINDDDFADECQLGHFPLLTSISTAACMNV